MRTRILRYGIRPILSAVTAATALMAVPSNAFADYIWATVEKGQVRFALLENAGGAPNPQFEKYVADLTPQCGEKSLTLGTPREGARYAALPAGQNVVTAESTVGVRARGGAPYLLIYDAKGAVSLAAANTSTKIPAELLARKDGTELVISLRGSSAAIPDTDVWVQWPGSAEPSIVKTDSKGDVHVPWAASAPKSGFVGIRAMVTEAKSGEAEGKTYASIHRWTTLTFPIDSPQSEKSATKTVALGDKPLTQLLREAYGGNHEVVGNAAFNHTLFEGQLTFAQLEIHLQQRALIHNETHRILNAAPKGSVPYGAAQKNVLVLLFQDLIAMGSGWPTDAQIRPLTRDFLKEIRESEKKGPYFALGVQHVYYGGITNGGRMIGEKINETLHILPTYYEKSDGYREYLPEVNKITDPAAQQEMIRGGKAAYKYIIASSNEDIFKAKDGQK